jgi:F0F1-type ATP synthase assembly protein I
MAAETPSRAELMGMGAVIAAQLAAGLLLGLLVDSLAHTAPVFVLIGLLLGIIGAVAFTISKFRQYLKT